MLLITTYNFVCNHTIVENEWRIICSMVNVCVNKGRQDGYVYRMKRRSWRKVEGVCCCCVCVCWDTTSIDIICILQVLLEGFSVNWLSSRQFTLASFQVGDRCVLCQYICMCSLKYYYVWYIWVREWVYLHKTQCVHV